MTRMRLAALGATAALALAPVAIPPAQAAAAPTSTSTCVPTASPTRQATLAELSDPAGITTYEDAAATITGLRAALSRHDDHRGTFPIAFDEILRLVGPSIDAGIYDDPEWATDLTVEIVRLYVSALHDLLTGQAAPAHWQAAFDLTADCDRSPGRALMGQIFAHLVIDFPRALVAVDTAPRHTADFYTFGEALVDATPAIAAAFRTTYGVDVEPLFTAWFAGDVIGDDVATTLLFQSTRTAALVNSVGLRSALTRAATEVGMSGLNHAANAFMDVLEAAGQFDRIPGWTPPVTEPEVVAPAPPPVATATPTVTIKLVRKKVTVRAKAKLRVWVAGAAVAGGTVLVHDRGRLVKRATLGPAGTVTVKLPRLRRGIHKLRAQVLAGPTYAAGWSKKVKLTVRR